MFSLVAFIMVLAVVFFVMGQNGKWRQRARSAEEKNRADRLAHDLQNDVVRDPAFRERVRRYFDSP